MKKTDIVNYSCPLDILKKLDQLPRGYKSKWITRGLREFIKNHADPKLLILEFQKQKKELVTRIYDLDLKIERLEIYIKEEKAPEPPKEEKEMVIC